MEESRLNIARNRGGSRAVKEKEEKDKRRDEIMWSKQPGYTGEKLGKGKQTSRGWRGLGYGGDGHRWRSTGRSHISVEGTMDAEVSVASIHADILMGTSVSHRS